MTNAQRSAEAVAAFRFFLSNVQNRLQSGQGNVRINNSAAFRAYLFFVISNLQSYIQAHGGFSSSNLQSFFSANGGFNTFLSSLTR